VRKKILIIGDGSSVFVLNHAKNVTKYSDKFDLDILLTNCYLKDEYKGYFKNFYYTYTNSILTRIPKIKGAIIRLMIIFALLRFKKKYDIVHIQFINDNIIYFNIFRKFASKVIISVWGSDFYKAKGMNLWLKKRILKNADIITFANDQTKDDFLKKISTDAQYKICRFGLLPLEYIETINSSKMESKKFLNIPENNTVITIGYNLNKNQQHIKIIEEIEKLKSNSCFSDLLFILPLTYPEDKYNYKSEIKNHLNKSGINYRLIEDFLPETDNAHLRNASDIMIQLQISDQLSGAMQEYLYTENLVITGSWLPYKVLIDNEINMILLNSISELSSVLDKSISNLENLKQSLSKNRKIIMKLSSWRENVKYWIELYA
jgi:hypothetical protein